MENALQTTKKTDSPMLSMIREMITNPDINVANLQSAQEMYYREMDRQTERLYNEAMLRLRPQLPRIKKHGEIDYGKGKKAIKYAFYEDIEKEIEPLYQAEGFFIEYDHRGGEYYGICKHSAGHKVEKHITLPRDDSGGKNPVQGTKSSFKYAQRALLEMIFNLKFEGEDDDGNRAGMKFIDDAGIQQINALIEETKTNRDGFLQNYFGVAHPANILMKDKDRAINLLMGKKAKMQGAQNGNNS